MVHTALMSKPTKEQMHLINDSSPTAFTIFLVSLRYLGTKPETITNSFSQSKYVTDHTCQTATIIER